MIQYNSINTFKEIHYNGEDIKYVYDYQGKVWEKESPVPPTPTFKWEATYTTGTSSAECDGSSVITSGDGFHSNTELISIIIGECIDEIGVRAFDNCTKLISVTIGSNVTSIGNDAFYQCGSLPSIEIPSGVTSIGDGAFRSCRSLTNIEISDSVTSIGQGCFYGCSGLTSISIPSSVASIGYNAFRNCSSLTNVTIEATTPPTLGIWSFDNTNDCSILVPAESLETYKTATNWSTYASRIQAIPNS